MRSKKYYTPLEFNRSESSTGMRLESNVEFECLQELKVRDAMG